MDRLGSSDVEWTSALSASLERAEITTLVSAAKLHVLRLEPIKVQLGARWPQLSELVHRLFEKSIRQAQGPQDHFVLLEDFSYVATFHGLCKEEAGLACNAIAKQVCDLLFGADGEKISVRCVVGAVSAPVAIGSTHEADLIGALLERDGVETIVSSRSNPCSLSPNVTETDAAKRIHQLANLAGLTVGLIPVWDLQRGSCHSLLLRFRGGQEGRHAAVRTLLKSAGIDPLDFELAALQLAQHYSKRVHEAGQVCSLTFGVSYETLSVPQSRARYLKGLRTLERVQCCPLVLKIEDIPLGVVVARLAELVAQTGSPNLRVALEFQPKRGFPQVDMRLGVSGMGLILPKALHPDEAMKLTKTLVCESQQQKCFTFIGGLNNSELLEIAKRCGVRFGTGTALGAIRLSGFEDVPSFPLIERENVATPHC